MRDAWFFIIVGFVLLVVGLAIMNLPFGFNGEGLVTILGWVLVVIGIILIGVGILYLVRGRT